MTSSSRHDAWQSGDSYDLYMGRWSRQIAPRFLDWLGAPAGLDWLDVGCGTGAVSAAIIAQSHPKHLIGVDRSESFVERARTHVPDGRAEFRTSDAESLIIESASRDVIVSGLVLNFIPNKQKALAEMKRVARKGATVGFYVWDYPGGGQEFVRAFWTAATAIDSSAHNLTEARRFPFCTPEALIELVDKAGFTSISGTAIEMEIVFADFDDFWVPFTQGGGPAPGYCKNLDPDVRQRLRDNLHASLPRREDGSISMTARAWAVRATAP